MKGIYVYIGVPTLAKVLDKWVLTKENPAERHQARFPNIISLPGIHARFPNLFIPLNLLQLLIPASSIHQVASHALLYREDLLTECLLPLTLHNSNLFFQVFR